MSKRMIRIMSWKSLKANRVRNGFVVMAIILTTVLFTSVTSMGANLVKSMEYAYMKQVGTTAHGGYKGISEAAFEQLAKHPDIVGIGKTKVLGVDEGLKQSGKILEVRYADEQWASFGFSTPTKGDLPQAENEFATASWVLRQLDVPVEIGTEVDLSFQIGDRVFNDRFTVSGIWEADEFIAAVGMGLVSEAYYNRVIDQVEAHPNQLMKGLSGPIDASVMLRTSMGIEGNLARIAEESGVEITNRQLAVNWAYTSSTLMDDPANITPFVVVALLIFLSSYLLIYNIFYISIANNTRFYGLLKTIGMTPSQLKDMIRLQASMLSVVGIPVGLIVGAYAGNALTPLLLQGSGLQNSVVTAVYPLSMLLSAVLSFVTVQASCRKPMKIASGISPIDATRYTGVETSGRKKETKTTTASKLHRMALSNVFRNKKKAYVVMASLTISIVLFNFVYGMIAGFSPNHYVQSFIRGDFVIGDSSYMTHYTHFEENDTVNEALLSQLSVAERIDRVYYTEMSAVYSETVDQNLRTYIEKVGGDGSRAESARKAIADQSRTVQLYGLDPGWNTYIESSALVKGTFDAKAFASGNAILVPEHSGYAIGDKVGISLGNGDTKQYTVMAIVEEAYVYDVKYSIVGAFKAYLPSSAFKELVLEPKIMAAQLFAKPGFEHELEKEINQLTQKEALLDYRSKADYLEEYSQFIRMFTMVGYALAGIIGLIGILNFVNTMLTSVAARKMEFAMLESIGMTRKQLVQMLIYEGGVYAACILGLTFTVGAVIVYYAVNAFGGQMAHFTYTFKQMPWLNETIAVLLLTSVTAVGAYSISRKATIVERLREIAY